jgi:hypothetical protein
MESRCRSKNVIPTKIYGSEKMLFDASSRASSFHHMNGYESKTMRFSFLPGQLAFEKNGSMLLGKFMRQGHSTVNYLNSLPEHTHAIRENLYESRKRI